MATAVDACANIQTETERETTTTKLKIKEAGAEKTADIQVETDEEEDEYEVTKTVVQEEHEEAEEDTEVLYDSLELPQIPAIKTSAVAALEQKLTKTAANQFQVEVRVENGKLAVEDDEHLDAAAAQVNALGNGEKQDEENEEEAESKFKREQTEQQDVVDCSKLQQQLAQRTQRDDSCLIDDIPEPIKVLDDIISEFEASSDVKPAIGSVENQSEDDGYMSLSRKK